MVRPVLGTDPFAKTGAIGAAASPAPEAKTTGAESSGVPAAGSRSVRRTPRTPAPVRAKPVKRAPATGVPLEELDARFTEMEERLEQRIDERLESRFGTLEAKLDEALSRLGGHAPEDEDGEEEEETFADDDASDGDDDAFVGFLKDAPKATRARSDDSSSESDTSFDADEHFGFLDDDDTRTKSSLLGGLLDLLTPGGLGRHLGEVGMRGRSNEVDEFGMDPVAFEQASRFFNWLYEKYWRVDVEGLEYVPDEGRGLIVGNHSGTLPFDGVMIATAARLHHPAQREVRALAEDMFSTLPFVAPLMARVGGVRACPENALRLLRKDELVVVFPEGVKGAGKYFRERYQLQRFGRGGFIKLCIQTGAPLIPVAVVGSEEIYPILAKADWIGKPLGLPYTPITPTFPWLGLLGLIPLPTKWRIRFGEPMSFDDYGPDALEDDILINHLKEEVRGCIQDMVDDMLEERESVWFG